ncbi:unnamed protein product [Acanthoscelides obtectus]|uniref:Uncharacterized protein n=1 Tax=Acanthoscelides obtectus TaxID=200917 RepID=A0A9P0KD29_ACAOB|nr:unnamed protein product [Acanthoscelides obtectus]CAK1667494.1 hypothetical protein AOBTE_LOCUS25870 [Acanthoscelides obtectus]
MAESPTPSPSAPKCLRIKNPKVLTEDELRALAYLSSSSDEEPLPDSGSIWNIRRAPRCNVYCLSKRYGAVGCCGK